MATRSAGYDRPTDAGFYQAAVGSSWSLVSHMQCVRQNRRAGLADTATAKCTNEYRRVDIAPQQGAIIELIMYRKKWISIDLHTFIDR